MKKYLIIPQSPVRLKWPPLHPPAAAVHIMIQTWLIMVLIIQEQITSTVEGFDECQDWRNSKYFSSYWAPRHGDSLTAWVKNDSALSWALNYSWFFFFNSKKGWASPPLLGPAYEQLLITMYDVTEQQPLPGEENQSSLLSSHVLGWCLCKQLSNGRIYQCIHSHIFPLIAFHCTITVQWKSIRIRNCITQVKENL